MKIVALIPARGGSKRIPRKNLVMLNGKPLIYYAIKASLESNVDETFVSTEDMEIAKVSVNYGSKVLTRPPELATDNATTDDVLLHFCEKAPGCDIIVLIQPTSPMIRSEYINIGINMVKSKEWDSVFSSVPMHEADILFWECNKYGMSPVNYDLNNRSRSVRKDNYKIENGSFYVATRESILSSKCRLSGRIGTVDIPFWMMFEIDTEEDLKNIEKLMRD